MFVINAGSRHEAQDWVKCARFNANFLAALASCCLFGALPALNMACNDFNEFAQPEREMSCDPELADQHNHIAGRIYRQHANDMANVQNVARDRTRAAIGMA